MSQRPFWPIRPVSIALVCAALAAPAAPRTKAPVAQSPDSSIVASDRLGEGWWADRHKALLAMVAAHPDPQILLIGDSITNNYDKSAPPDENFRPTWQTFYAPRGALNLGFSGDTTSNVLWRLQHGEIAGLQPKVVMLLIGTNDTGLAARSAVETQRGIDAVVADLELRLPDTKILLLGILPSAISETKTATDTAVNAYLARTYAGNPRVTYLDIGSVFRRADGTVNDAIYYDPRLSKPGKPLHPDTIGQRMMAEAIEPTLAALLSTPPRLPLAAMRVDTAAIPVPRLERDSYDWYARHQAVLALARTARPRVVMIGDSITHFWAGEPYGARITGPKSWQRLFGTTPVLNLGFGWDRTQNVLWRLRQGEFDGLTPHWVVINIGTNNLTGSDNARANTPEEVLTGVEAIVRTVHAASPTSRIVLMAIFPRGTKAGDPLRTPIAQTNRLLAARFGRDPSVKYLDIAARFLSANGELPVTLMPDGTHPSEAGYAIWADALAEAGVR